MFSITSMVSLLCAFHIIALVSGLSIVLDTSGDVNRIWKIKGDTLYVDSGRELRQAAVSQFLPTNFKHTHFDLTRGIWAVVPNGNKECAVFGDKHDDPWSWDQSSEEHDHHDDDPDNRTSTTDRPKSTSTTAPACDISAVGSLQCSLNAQLMASVAVRYNFGGNATIRITGLRRQPFEIFANNLQSNNWEYFKVDLDGRMMLLEAIVNTTGDYILIDRITIETLEPSTTHRPTRHTTPRGSDSTPATPTSPSTKSSSTSTPSGSPTHGPAPASGQSGMLTNFPTSMILTSNLLTVVIAKFIFF